MGYFVTKIAVKKSRKKAEADKAKARRSAASPSAASSRKILTTFTRQLSILQDAGLPILRSLRILEGQAKAGPAEELADRRRATKSKPAPRSPRRMAKCPKAFDRLYVNMIKAGEAGGALEVILQRLAEFQERAESLKRKVKGAMIYPVVVVIGGRRHLDVHHDQDRAGVREDLRRLRHSSCRR